MYDVVEFRHLKYFLTVVQEGNFTRAAERLHVAQPSLSAQIKQMEDDISAQLFVREKSGAMLTPAAKALVPFAEQLLQIREQAMDVVHAIHCGTVPPLTIGFSHFIDHALVERAFVCYRRLFPESTIRPTTQCTAQLLTSLSNGKIHAALVTLPVEQRDLVIQPIACHRLLVCMRKDDPLASEGAVSPRKIVNRLQISFDPKHHPALYAYLDSTLARAGIAMQATHLCTTPNDVQWMVRQRLGYALVREERALDPELVARPIENVELIAESAFVYRDTGQCSHLALLACELRNTMIRKSVQARATTKIKPREAASPRMTQQMKLLE